MFFFYTLFLFDTLGDSVGFENALWVLVVMPLMPLFMYLCVCGYERRYPAYVPPSKPCENGISMMTEIHSTSETDGGREDGDGSKALDVSKNPMLSGLGYGSVVEPTAGPLRNAEPVGCVTVCLSNANINGW